MDNVGIDFRSIVWLPGAGIAFPIWDKGTGLAHRGCVHLHLYIRIEPQPVQEKPEQLQSAHPITIER